MELENQSRIADAQTVTERVVVAVARHIGRPPTELEPMYRVIDPDALDSLFQDGTVGHVQFSYHDHEVTVHSDGRIHIG